MYKLNHLQYAQPKPFSLDASLSLDPLKNNFEFDKLVRNFKNRFNFEKLNSFSFNEDGFLSMMLKLGGKIAVSLGESQAIVSAAQQYQKAGFDVNFIPLSKEGLVDIDSIKEMKCDYIFISSYVMDTFIKTDLKKVKKLSKATIISNLSASKEQIEYVDVALFDAYKLTGYQTHSVALHNEVLNEQFLSQYDYAAIAMIYDAIENQTVESKSKASFIKALQEELEGDMFFFVDNKNTLENSVHFGLKDIKAREIIRTLALNSIYVSNGEGCSLGLSRPSKIIQAMGYSEGESRQALSLSFNQPLNKTDINTIVKTISKNYRQIRMLNA